MNRFVYLPKVSTLALDPEKCIGCGRCREVCPHEVFAQEAKKASIQDMDACMECGACARNCPVQAITVDAGVGCASGLLSQALGKKNALELCC